jgi:hypothetical protein
VSRKATKKQPLRIERKPDMKSTIATIALIASTIAANAAPVADLSAGHIPRVW